MWHIDKIMRDTHNLNILSSDAHTHTHHSPYIGVAAIQYVDASLPVLVDVISLDGAMTTTQHHDTRSLAVMDAVTLS